MGIEIYPQILKSGLITVNEELRQTIKNAQPYIKSIEDYIKTDKLDSIAFGSQKDYMNRGHLTTVKGQIQAMQSLITANQTHMNLIDRYLEGESHINEDTLQEEIQCIRHIQQIADSLQLLWICNMMNELECRIEQRINNLYGYEKDQRELYDSVMVNIEMAELLGSNLHDVSYDCSTNKYVLPSNMGNRLFTKEEQLFIDNLQKQFGFDQKTAVIMLEVYNSIKIEYTDVGQKEIDRMFARSISQLCYNKGNQINNQWRAGAGYQYGYDKKDEFNYFVNTLGLSEQDYQYLRQMVRLQQFMVSSPNTYSYNAVKMLKKENYDEFKIWKENMEIATGRNFTDKQYLDYYKQLYLDIGDKPDFAHMMYTISANLATKNTKGVDNNFPDFPIDMISGNFWNGSKVRREFTGWLGDATYTGQDGISFGNDDYQSDLDASNIAIRVKNGSAIIESMNDYYANVSEDSSVRCREFLDNTDYVYVEEKVFTAADVDSLDQLKNKDGWFDSYKFLWNLKEGNGIMKIPKE